MEDPDKNKRYFKTSNFYAAAYLFAKGMELINIDRSEPQRSHFVFFDTPDRESLLQQFSFAKDNSPDVMVDARKLIMSIKMLKDKLYQNEF